MLSPNDVIAFMSFSVKWRSLIEHRYRRPSPHDDQPCGALIRSPVSGLARRVFGILNQFD